MPTQWPTLNQAEQTARWENMAKQNLFPYSYPFAAAWSNNTDFGNTFNRSATIGNSITISYFTMEFKADNNLAISILDYSASVNFFLVGTSSRSIFVTEVSYFNAMDPNVINNVSTPPALPTAPLDTGNTIYRRIDIQRIDVSTATVGDQQQNVVDYHRYEPYNYLVKFNQSIYIHVGLYSALGANNAGQMFGDMIFHTLPTGLKV